MKKVIKIGFPIVCVVIIGGTFILLNNATDRIRRNRLENEEKNTSVNNTVVSTSSNEIVNEVIENVVNTIDPEEVKIQEVRNKARAIDIVKLLTHEGNDCYYTNEGMDNDKYIVAIRKNDTKNVKIYYAVDIQNQKIEIYEKLEVK